MVLICRECQTAVSGILWKLYSSVFKLNILSILSAFYWLHGREIYKHLEIIDTTWTNSSLQKIVVCCASFFTLPAQHQIRPFSRICNRLRNRKNRDSYSSSSYCSNWSMWRGAGMVDIPVHEAVCLCCCLSSQQSHAPLSFIIWSFKFIVIVAVSVPPLRSARVPLINESQSMYTDYWVQQWDTIQMRRQIWKNQVSSILVKLRKLDSMIVQRVRVF